MGLTCGCLLIVLLVALFGIVGLSDFVLFCVVMLLGLFLVWFSWFVVWYLCGIV